MTIISLSNMSAVALAAGMQFFSPSYKITVCVIGLYKFDLNFPLTAVFLFCVPRVKSPPVFQLSTLFHFCPLYD